MRIAATAIVYNKDKDFKHLTRMLESCEKAGTTDYVLGIDSKSLPQTEAWFRERLGERVTLFPFEFNDDFGAARNLTLEHIPEGIDWFYWIDTDDALEMVSGKTLEEVLKEVPPQVYGLFSDYNYAQDEFGNPMTTIRRLRFCRTQFQGKPMRWYWKDPVHEDIHPGDLMHEMVICDDFLWVHDASEEGRDNTRNFRIIYKALEKEPDAPRFHYYLANQHFAAHNWAQAIDSYNKYIGLSNWPEEKWQALIQLATACRALGMYPESIKALTHAMTLRPDWPDSYFDLGDTYTRVGEWQKALQFGEIGMRLVSEGKTADPTVFVNSLSYTFRPLLWLSVCYYNLKQEDKALSCLEQAAGVRPEPEIVTKVNHLRAAINRKKAINYGLALAAHLVKTNEPLKAKKVLEALPAGAADNGGVVVAAEHKVHQSIKHLYDPVAYRNLYYEQRETIDPLEGIENVPVWYPRMAWVLSRLKAAGVKKVLDVGIGNAVSSFYYALNGIQVVGIDVDASRVKDANWNAVKAGLIKAKHNKEVGMKVPVLESDSKVQFHWCPAEGITQKVRDLGPFDAVVGAEIIEHVLDPQAFLDQMETLSTRIILSTPDFSYEGPQEVNPSHVQGWSQREFAQLVSKRGKLIELHKVAHPNPNDQPNLVCEYVTDQTIDPTSPPVVIWCPNTGQEWTPESINKGGIGGSETAVIRVAEELNAKGFRVSVYAEADGVWNGVRYAPVERFVPRPTWLFVSWRSPAPLKDMKEFAQHRWLWAHDVTFGPATAEDLAGVKVLALSEWHKTFLQEQYPSADIFVSGNGIDPARFAKKVRREKHRIIYASSPDRGLDIVLKQFPKIREKYADASLHVYYGFDAARSNNPKFIAMVEQLAQQPGVTLHGKVDQQTLAEAYQKSDIWLYPSTMPNGEPFHETYCISAIEAQAAGCLPITVNWGALPEVVRMPGAKDLDELFTNVLQFMSSDHEEYRKTRRDWALQQTWGKVVDGWLTLATEAEVVAA